MTLPSERNNKPYEHGSASQRDAGGEGRGASGEPQGGTGRAAAPQGAQHLDNILARINALLAEPQPAEALQRELRAASELPGDGYGGAVPTGGMQNKAPEFAGLRDDRGGAQPGFSRDDLTGGQGGGLRRDEAGASADQPVQHEWAPDHEIYVAGEEFDEAAQQASRAFLDGARERAAGQAGPFTQAFDPDGAVHGQQEAAAGDFQPSEPEDMLAPYSEVLNEVRDYFQDRHSLDPDDRLSDRVANAEPSFQPPEDPRVDESAAGDEAGGYVPSDEIFSPLTFDSPLASSVSPAPASPHDAAAKDAPDAPQLSGEQTASPDVAAGEPVRGAGEAELALQAGDLGRFRRELMDRIGQLETVMGNHFVDRTEIARDAARMAVEMTLQSLEETPVGQRVAALEGAFEKFRQIQLDREQQTGEMIEKLGAALLKSHQAGGTNEKGAIEGADEKAVKQSDAEAEQPQPDAPIVATAGEADGLSEASKAEAGEKPEDDDVRRLTEKLETDGIHDEGMREEREARRRSSDVADDDEGDGTGPLVPLGSANDPFAVREVEATPVASAPVVSTAGLDYSGAPDIPAADGAGGEGGVSELQEVYDFGEMDDDHSAPRQKEMAGEGPADPLPPVNSNGKDVAAGGVPVEVNESEREMMDQQAIEQDYSTKSSRLREQFKNSTIVSNDEDLINIQRRGARPAVIVVVVALLLAAAGIALRNNNASLQGLFGGLLGDLTGSETRDGAVPPATLAEKKQIEPAAPDLGLKKTSEDVSITGNISRRSETPLSGKISPRLSDGVGEETPEMLLPSDSSSLSLPPALIGPYSLRHKAANGDPAAQYEVAHRFGLGEGIEQNYDEAVRWYMYAAAQGFAPAQYRLATYYERGRGVARNLKRAQVWYKRAAELGNVKAMHNLAVLSTTIDRENPDYKTALRWFREAAKRNLADSQFNLAVLYQGGVGVRQNNVEAYKWLSLAARQGDRDAAARRDGLEKKLSQKELLLASNMLQGWEPLPVKLEANHVGKMGRHMTSTMSHAEETVARSRILTAQILLRKIGYPLIEADGALNEETVEAIKKFEKDKGLPVTGKVSAPLLQALNRAAL